MRYTLYQRVPDDKSEDASARMDVHCHNLIIKITNYISKKVFDDDTRLPES